MIPYLTIYDAWQDMAFECFRPGPTEIWYMRPDWFSEGIRGAEPNKDDLPATHILLGLVISENLEELFAELQGENWSPEGEANGMLKELGLSHTSMSVGDVISTPHGTFLALPVGFKEL